jgi:hypothetical protein
MRVVQAMINGSRNYLEDNADVDALKEEIVAACAAGGGFVDLRLSGGRTLSVLVTEATGVSFEVRDVEEEEYLDDESSESGRMHIDGDYWVD